MVAAAVAVGVRVEVPVLGVLPALQPQVDVQGISITTSASTTIL